MDHINKLELLGGEARKIAELYRCMAMRPLVAALEVAGCKYPQMIQDVYEQIQRMFDIQKSGMDVDVATCLFISAYCPEALVIR